MAESKERREQRLQKVHERALSEFDKVQIAMRDERMQCLADRRFYSIAGAQWEGDWETLFENRPRLEINKIHLSVIRLINEYRQNRITVDFMSKEGSEYDELADTCDGLYRADEQDSSAEEAYDNAYEEAVGGGFGAWRLRADYEDEEDEDDDRQRIRIEPIFDADTSVFFDLGAKKQDKSDATKCWVVYPMTIDDYMDQYGEDPTTWPKGITQRFFDWYSSAAKTVYVAEYYEVETTRETIRRFDVLGEIEKYSQEEIDSDSMIMDRLEAINAAELPPRKVKRKKVRKYIMSGNRVLEDLGYIAGSNIPIVPVYGKRWVVDNVERCMGHVRLSKDMQRLKNIILSKVSEIAALSSSSKPIFTPEEIAGHELDWANDNIENNAYLLKNTITDKDGNETKAATEYTQPPQIPQAIAALMQSVDLDINDLLGNQQAGEQVNPNLSGKAIELIQGRIDMQGYIYLSNFSKSIKRSGEIWLGMARDIFQEQGRKLKTVSQNGDVGTVELMKPVISEETGEVEFANDMREAKFDIAVDVGPSSSSKKSATVRALTEMMQMTQNPETLDVLSSMALMNMEGEGIGDMRDYFRKKMVRMGVVKPNEKEMEELQQEMANAQPDPQSQLAISMARQAEAEATKAQTETLLTMEKARNTDADTENKQAKTVEILEKINRENLAAALDAQEQISSAMQPEFNTLQHQG